MTNESRAACCGKPVSLRDIDDSDPSVGYSSSVRVCAHCGEPYTKEEIAEGRHLLRCVGCGDEEISLNDLCEKCYRRVRGLPPERNDD